MDIQKHIYEDRLFNPDLYIHKVISKDEGTLSVMLTDFEGKFVGVQTYNPLGDKRKRHSTEGRYFTYLPKNTHGVFGLEYQSKHYPNLLVITEGIFKACRFHNAGIQAIASLTNDPKFARKDYKKLQRKYITIVVTDPDKAGQKLAKYGMCGIVPTKPIDEMNEYEFESILNSVMYQYDKIYKSIISA